MIAQLRVNIWFCENFLTVVFVHRVRELALVTHTLGLVLMTKIVYLQAWTGDGGAAFNYLQSEASSPIEEAEQDRQDTLDGDNPDDSDDESDLYGSWGGDGRGRHGRHHQDALERLRKQ